MQDQTVLSVRVPLATVERLRQRSLIEDRPLARIIRRAIEQYLDSGDESDRHQRLVDPTTDYGRP